MTLFFSAESADEEFSRSCYCTCFSQVRLPIILVHEHRGELPVGFRHPMWDETEWVCAFQGWYFLRKPS